MTPDRLRSQVEHDGINRREWPGTRQLCVECNCATGRCEEDSLYAGGEIDPLCESCWTEFEEKR